eukprot:4901607-Prymnesium_polylepis.1
MPLWGATSAWASRPGGRTSMWRTSKAPTSEAGRSSRWSAGGSGAASCRVSTKSSRVTQRAGSTTSLVSSPLSLVFGKSEDVSDAVADAKELMADAKELMADAKGLVSSLLNTNAPPSKLNARSNEEDALIRRATALFTDRFRAWCDYLLIEREERARAEMKKEIGEVQAVLQARALEKARAQNEHTRERRSKVKQKRPEDVIVEQWHTAAKQAILDYVERGDKLQEQPKPFVRHDGSDELVGTRTDEFA